MGYWEQDEHGRSFTKAKGATMMLWGDAPADAMGDALEAITRVFHRDMGRLPTEKEIRAGLEFSLPHALERAQKELEHA